MFTELPEAAAQRYQIQSVLGEGASGVVYTAVDLHTNMPVALKHIESHAGGQLPPSVTAELQAQHIKHDNVAVVREVYREGFSCVLVLDLLEVDLASVIQCHPSGLHEGLAANIMQQLLRAVGACHNAGVLHRDVKPQNIMLTRDGTVKLSDFGSSGRADAGPRQTAAVGTRWYKAPELLYGAANHTCAADMWSVGCTMAEMLGGKPLFAGIVDIEQLANIHRVLGPLSLSDWPEAASLPDYGKLLFTPPAPVPLTQLMPGVSHQALDLVGRLLLLNPGKRATAQEALMHPFLLQATPSTAHDLCTAIHQASMTVKASLAVPSMDTTEYLIC